MRTVLIDGDYTYTVSLDSGMSAGSRSNALVQARVLDELTGMPVTSGVTVVASGAAFDRTAARANVISRVASGGIVGLVGVPATVFPQLKSQSYEVGMTVHAEGYLPARVVESLGAQSEFPSTFSLASLGDVELHRPPIMVCGRTVQRTATGFIPVANATVRVKGIWRKIPASNVVAAPNAPDLLSIDPPMYMDRNHATTTLRSVDIDVSASDLKTTLEPIMHGVTVLRLSNGMGLSAGDTIMINDSHSESREVVTVSGINGSVSGLGPVSVSLEFPVRCAHPKGATVRKAVVTNPGVAQALSVNAMNGDATLLCTSVAQLSTETFLEISSPSSENEYHWLRPYVVTSDANGDYRLPPISRVAQIAIEAQYAGHSPVEHVIGPKYPAYEQILDFTFV